jgi:hypothetical protein
MRIIELNAGDGSHWTVELHPEGESAILKKLGKNADDVLTDDEVKAFFLEHVVSAKEAEIVETAKG